MWVDRAGETRTLANGLENQSDPIDEDGGMRKAVAKSNKW